MGDSPLPYATRSGISVNSRRATFPNISGGGGGGDPISEKAVSLRNGRSSDPEIRPVRRDGAVTHYFRISSIPHGRNRTYITNPTPNTKKY